jgi:hypothetical protein
MKLLLFAALLSIGCSLSAWAQDDTVVHTSPLADSGRYEYIRAPKDRTATFRLDKYSGKIHRLTTCPRDDSEGSALCLKEMTVVDPIKGPFASRVRFQIYIDTLSRMTLLLDLETGKAWQFGIDPLEKWHPFLECNDRVVNACFWRPY